MSRDHYDKIRLFLVADRFPFYENHISQGELINVRARSKEDVTERDEIIAYSCDLRLRSCEELDRLAATARAATRLRTMYERELDHFLPDLDSHYLAADFGWWTKYPHWTAEEAAALALGADPRRCGWIQLQPHAVTIPFAAKYLDLCDLIERAQHVGELNRQILPAAFIVWADCRLIDRPQALIDAVKAAPPNLQSSSARIEELEKQIEELKASANRGLHPKRQRSIANLLMGLLVHHYGHSPEMKRNSTASRAAANCEAAGYLISEDTVLELMREFGEGAKRRGE